MSTFQDMDLLIYSHSFFFTLKGNDIYSWYHESESRYYELASIFFFFSIRNFTSSLCGKMLVTVKCACEFLVYNHTSLPTSINIYTYVAGSILDS